MFHGRPRGVPVQWVRPSTNARHEDEDMCGPGDGKESTQGGNCLALYCISNSCPCRPWGRWVMHRTLAFFVLRCLAAQMSNVVGINQAEYLEPIIQRHAWKLQKVRQTSWEFSFSELELLCDHHLRLLLLKYMLGVVAFTVCSRCSHVDIYHPNENAAAIWNPWHARLD